MLSLPPPPPSDVRTKVDVEIEEMCSKHARGEPVTITRGGNRVRLRAAMPNGGATLVTYDTRVTSQVCGRVICVHSDNTEVKPESEMTLYMKNSDLVPFRKGCAVNKFFCTGFRFPCFFFLKLKECL